MTDQRAHATEAGPTSPPATVSLSATRARPTPSPFTRSPFFSLLSAPVAPPWG